MITADNTITKNRAIKVVVTSPKAIEIVKKFVCIILTYMLLLVTMM